MKREEKLFEAIGQVDDRLVEEAADARRTVSPWRRWVPLAASVVLVVGLGAGSLSVMMRGCASSDTSSAVTDTATSTDTAADQESQSNTSAGADGSDDAGTDTATDTTTDSAVDDGAAGGLPEDGLPSYEESAEESYEESAEESYEESAESVPVLLPLTADADGLTAERTVTASAGTVTDVYRITNAGGGTAVTFRYPAAADAALTAEGADEIAAEAGTWAPYPDGDVVDVTWHAVTVELAAGETVTVTASVTVKPGTYTVWRDAASRLTVTAVTVDGAPLTGETATITVP